MPTRLNDGMRDSLLDKYNDIFSLGLIRVFDGVQPADPNTSPVVVLLGTLTLPSQPFAATTAGTIEKNGAWLGEIVATGVAGWFRMYSPDFSSWVDGDITLAGGGGVIIISDNNFIAGNVFVVDSVNITQPAE